MTVHNIYIFDQNGMLVFYREWDRKKPCTMSREEEGKLVYGILVSLSAFLEKVSPLDMKDDSFNYKTSKYKLTYWASPSGIKFVINTDINAANVKDLLKLIYQQVYVEYAVKNPLYTLGTYIESDLFVQKLDETVKSSLCYTTKGS